jgi:hypothetical protein
MTAICNNKHILTITVEWIKDSLQGKREGEAPRIDVGRRTFSRFTGTFAPWDIGRKGSYVQAQADVPANISERTSYVDTETLKRLDFSGIDLTGAKCAAAKPQGR